MEDELYRRYRNGDEAAFAEIVKLYFSNMVFFIDRYVHDPEEAQDIAIDTFTELVVHPGRYNFKTSLKTYLFAIARHKALNFVKRRSRRPEEADPGHDTVTGSAEERIMADQQKRQLHEAMASLPEDQRIAVHLVYFEDLSCEDAAKVMKKSRKQVYNLLYRAKTALRDILERPE